MWVVEGTHAMNASVASVRSFIMPLHQFVQRCVRSVLMV
jgi:hypothetical protein